MRRVTYLWTAFHLRFDETEEMLLIHAARVVDVGIDLTNVIEIPEGNAKRIFGRRVVMSLTCEEHPSGRC
jgi:hypothetical protein